MKNKLFLGLTLLTTFCLASCGTNEAESPSSDASSVQEPSSQIPPVNEDARLLKKVAGQMMEMSKNKMPSTSSAIKTAWNDASNDSLVFELRQPGIYFYLIGRVLERANYNITDKPINFKGEYNLVMGEDRQYMSLEIEMKAVLDKDNNKMFFSGYQYSKQGPDKEHTSQHDSPLFYEVGFDYSTEQVQDFKYYQTSGSPTLIYFEYDKNTDHGRYYIAQEDDETEDGLRLRSEYNSRKNSFDALLEDKIVVTGEQNKQCCLAFSDTQDYVNSIFGNTSMTMEYIEE